MAHKRIGFAIELLREEIQAPADRAALPDQIARLRDMRGKAIKLFTHVGLGRDQNRFLMQTIRIKSFGLFQQCRDLLGKPRPDRFRLASRGFIGAFGERRNFGQAGRRNRLPRTAPFLPAHLSERTDRIAKTL